MYFSEIKFELRVEKAKLGSFENFSNEMASFLEDFYSDIEGSNKELRLYVLIHIMKSCNIWGSITYH